MLSTIIVETQITIESSANESFVDIQAKYASIITTIKLSLSAVVKDESLASFNTTFSQLKTNGLTLDCPGGSVQATNSFSCSKFNRNCNRIISGPMLVVMILSKYAMIRYIPFVFVHIHIAVFKGLRILPMSWQSSVFFGLSVWLSICLSVCLYVCSSTVEVNQTQSFFFYQISCTFHI